MSGRLIVDSSKIIGNIISTKSKTKCKICAVVKANCYGIGLDIIKKIENFVDMFAVCSVYEAIEVANLTDKDILVLAPPNQQDILNLQKMGLKNVIISADSPSIFEWLQNTKIKLRVHIAVNTGMNRYGIDTLGELKKMLKIAKNSSIAIEGIYSHFYSNDFGAQKEQYQKFEPFVKLLKSKFPDAICHISNSGGNYPMDMVRLGIGLYLGEQEAVQLESYVCKIRAISKNQIVSYNANFTATKNCKIAIVPVGYADGVNRKLTGSSVLVNGKFCKIIGNVCMDCFMILLDNVRAKVGDKVIIFGQSKNNKISVCNQAEYCDTISYEILTNISQRVERVYK